MKTQHGMRTRFVGNLAILAMVMGAFSGGVLTGFHFKKELLEEEYHLLPKEFYECFVGMMLNDPEQTKVCVVYRAKGINFEGNNLPRHREYNKEQGKRIHEF